MQLEVQVYTDKDLKVVMRLQQTKVVVIQELEVVEERVVQVII